MKKRIFLMLFVLVALVLALVSCGHDCAYTTVVAEVPANCETTGTRTLQCAECEEQIVEIIPATGHNLKTESITATCTQEGYTKDICQNPGCTYEVTSNKVTTLAHNYGTAETQIITKSVPADCENGGYDVVKCLTCPVGMESTKRINQTSKLDHAWKQETTWDNGIVPDCQTAGRGWQRTICDRCGKGDGSSAVEVVKNLGDIPHDIVKTDSSYIFEEIKATCQNAGSITYFCKVCAYTETDETMPVQNCDYSIVDKEIEAATCYRPRKLIVKCKYEEHTVNNTKEQTETGSELPHTPNVSTPDCANAKYCIECYKHFGAEAGFGDECDLNSENCSFCTYYNKIHFYAPATGEHAGETVEDLTVLPTCVSKGYKVRVCTHEVYDVTTGGTKQCGYQFSKIDENGDGEDCIAIAPDAHKYNDGYDQEEIGGALQDKIYPATCITYAYKTKTCVHGCGTVVSTELEDLGYAPHTFTNADHTGTIVCEHTGCTTVYYDTTYSKELVYDSSSDADYEGFGDGSDLSVTITGTKTELDEDGNPIDKHVVLDATNTTKSIAPADAEDEVVKGIKVIYIKKTGDITVTVKVNGTDYTVGEDGYVHLLNVEAIETIELTASDIGADASAKVYLYSTTIIGG